MPSQCLSVLLSGSAGDMGPAVLSGWVCHLGMWGRAQGLPLRGSCQVKYMSRSSINYSNWLSKAVLAPTLPPRGRMSSSSFDAPCAGGVPVPTLPFVPSPETCPHVPAGTLCRCEPHTHVGVCLSPTPNTAVVRATGWEVKASGRVWPRRGCSGAL